MTLSQIIVTSRYLKSGTQKSKNKRRKLHKVHQQPVKTD